MMNDAKLGLVAGIVGVLLLAVVYHHKPETTEAAPLQTLTHNSVHAPSVPPAAVVVPPPAKTRIVPVNAELPEIDPIKR